MSTDEDIILHTLHYLNTVNSIIFNKKMWLKKTWNTNDQFNQNLIENVGFTSTSRQKKNKRYHEQNITSS